MDNNTNIVTEQFESDLEKKKKPVAKIIGIILLLILCIWGYHIIRESLKVHINLNSYLTVDYSGYDGYGKINVTFDDWQIAEDNAEALDIENLMQLDSFHSSLSSYIEYEVIAPENLKNGDKIQIKWKVDNDKIEDKYNCRIEYKTETIYVSGLSEVVEYDPFMDLEVTFTGIAPYAKVNIDKSNVQYSTLTFSVDKTEGLNNGNVITVNLDNNVDNMCANNGIKITCSYKEYEVSGLASYIDGPSDISDEDLQMLVNDAQDGINAYIANNWTSSETLVDVGFEGIYFLTAKDNVDVSNKNYIYIVNKISAYNEDTKSGEYQYGDANGVFEYYYYTRYENLIMLEDGTISVDLTEKEVPEGGKGFVGLYGEAFNVGGFFYVGYEDIKTMFSDCVTSYIDEYNYESTVKQ